MIAILIRKLISINFTLKIIQFSFLNVECLDNWPNSIRNKISTAWFVKFWQKQYKLIIHWHLSNICYDFWDFREHFLSGSVYNTPLSRKSSAIICNIVVALLMLQSNTWWDKMRRKNRKVLSNYCNKIRITCLKYISFEISFERISSYLTRNNNDPQKRRRRNLMYNLKI